MVYGIGKYVMYCCSCSSGFLYIVKQGDGDLSLSQNSKLTQTDAIVHPPINTTTTTPQNNTHKIAILFNFILTKEKCSIMKKKHGYLASAVLGFEFAWSGCSFCAVQYNSLYSSSEISQHAFLTNTLDFYDRRTNRAQSTAILCSLCFCFCFLCLRPPKVSRSQKEVWRT